MAKRKDIPKQPSGFGAGLIWMATFYTLQFCSVIITITVCIVALSIKYSGENIEIEPNKIMEKIHERKNK